MHLNKTFWNATECSTNKYCKVVPLLILLVRRVMDYSKIRQASSW